jgi:RimJ/RimL family protein N-acetyltransferase
VYLPGGPGSGTSLVDDVDEIEILYAFEREFWRQGFASEIATALTDIGLLQLALPSLIGIVNVGNAASRRMLEKSNYLFERNTLSRGDDVVIYRIWR